MPCEIVCVLENFVKGGFLQIAFSKKWGYENLFSKLLQNALQTCERFWFSPNSKMTSKGILFSMKNYFKLFLLLAKRKRDFVSKKKIASKIVFVPKTVV